MKEVLTTNEAAVELDVSPSRVRQLILEGALYAEKHGRDYLIRASALEDYVNHGRRQRGRPRKERIDKF